MARIIYRGSDLPTSLFSINDVPSHTNVDGTRPSSPGADDVISSLACCDLCGTIFDDQWKPHKRGRRTVCRLCLDKR